MLTEIYKQLIYINKCKRGLRNNIILKSWSALPHFYFADKKVRVDYAKMLIMLKPISEVSNVTLQIIVQFYIFSFMNASSSFDIFCQRGLS